MESVQVKKPRIGRPISKTDIYKDLVDISLLVNEIIPLIPKWAQSSWGFEIVKSISEAFSHFSLSYYKSYTNRIDEGKNLVSSLEKIKFIARILVFGNLISKDKASIEKYKERMCVRIAALDTQIDKWNTYLNKVGSKDA